MKKTAFTLIEIILVVIIIAIVGGIFVKFVSTGNFSKKQTFGIECGMYLEEKIEDFVNKARKSSKIIIKDASGNLKSIQPSNYGIVFSSSTTPHTLQLKYATGSTTNPTYKNYQTNLLADAQCKNSNYNTKLVMTGNLLSKDTVYLEMIQGFMGNKPREISTFKLINPADNSIIGGMGNMIILQSCKGEHDASCTDVYKFDIDTATQRVNTSICWGYKMQHGEATNTCVKWR